jgi:hypothetical protein
MRKLLLFLLLLMIMSVLAACTSETGGTPDTSMPAGTSAPSAMPARPGSGVTGDPSASLVDLVEVKGTVKETKPGLILIELINGGGEFMLRLSENTIWDAGVSKDILAGNIMICQVKPEPTFTTPSQGEVYRVMENECP